MAFKSRVLMVMGPMLGLIAAPLWPRVASAHIELLEPTARYGDQENKSCPCGSGGSNRTCNVEQDGSDPNRSANVTTLEAGSTLTVRFDEYIDHGGRFRIAFDPDGADMADFNAHVLLDVADPLRVTSNTDQPGIWEFEVTLPDTPCENCTLQLVQAMHGNETDPVLDPAPLSSYYVCADLRLTAPLGATATGDEEESSSGSSTTAAEGTGSSTFDPSTGTSGGSTSSGGTTSSTTGDLDPTHDDHDSGSGGAPMSAGDATTVASDAGGSSDESSGGRDTAGSSGENTAPTMEEPTAGGCACDVGASSTGVPGLLLVGWLGAFRRRRARPRGRR